MALASDKARLLVESVYKDGLSKGIAQSVKSVDNLDKKFSRLGAQTSRGLGTAAKNLAKIGVVAGGVVAGGLLLAAKRAGEFDQQMRTINTIARVTDAQLGAVGASIRGLARETGADLADLTSGYYDVLSAGITDTADAQKVLAAATKLSIGALSTSGEAVDLLTTAMNAYGLKASDATHLTDIFAKSVEIGKVKASDIAATLANVAPIAHTAGISLEEIAASYGALTAQGLDASEVTTQMSRAIVELIKPSKNLQKLMEDTGHNYAKIAREKGLHVALSLLRKDADKAGIDILKLFGRIEGGKYVLQTTGSQAGLFEDALAAIGDSAGTAEQQFAEAEKGFGYSMGKLRAAGNDAAISLGKGLLPGLAKIADTIGKLVGDHGPQLERFGTQLGKVLDAIGTKLGSKGGANAIDRIFAALDRGLSDKNIRKAIDGVSELFGIIRDAMPALKSALQISSQVASKVVELFRGLPPWVQTAVITGWGLNKLTGGALGGIIGELAKGVIRGVLGITAGVVNIIAGKVTGGGLPGAAAGAEGAAAGAVGGGIGSKVAGLGVIGVGLANLATIPDLLGGIEKAVTGTINLDPAELAAGIRQGMEGTKFNPWGAATNALLGAMLPQLDILAGNTGPGGSIASAFEASAHTLTDDSIAAAFGKVTLDVKPDKSIGAALKALRNPKVSDAKLTARIGNAIQAIRHGADISIKGIRQLEGSVRGRLRDAIRSGDMTLARKLENQLGVLHAIRNKKMQVKVAQRQSQRLSAIATVNSSGAKASGGKDDVYQSSTQSQDYSRFLAAGAVGLATKATPAIFGEAGREAYAILKNPRMGMLGGGGPPVVHVHVNIDPRRITRKQTASGVYKTYVAT